MYTGLGALIEIDIDVLSSAVDPETEGRFF